MFGGLIKHFGQTTDEFLLSVHISFRITLNKCYEDGITKNSCYYNIFTFFSYQATQKDVDEFFDAERTFLMDYHAHLKDATAKSDRMIKAHKNVSDSYIKISSELIQLATIDVCRINSFGTILLLAY